MKRNWIIRYLIATAFVLLLVACGGGDTGDSGDADRIAELEAELDAMRIERDEAMAAGEAGGEVAAPVATGDGEVLGAVRSRGMLRCGGNAGLVGFGFLDPDTNEITGFDVDFCRAIAAAIFGDGGADLIEVTPTTGTSRFPTLQSGDVDVLIRNTTNTISRDTSLGSDFGPTNFYDGQGMMVRVDSGIETLEDLEGGSVCVQAGTTTEKNLADVFRAIDVQIETQVFPDNPSTTTAFQEGLCDGFTTDKSGLVSTRSTFETPDDFIILDATMSKEPLGPMWLHGDNNWGDIVTWTFYCTMQAEELGVTSDNVDDMLGSDDPSIQNLLGVSGELGQALQLDNDFCYQVIKQVGNYGEIYDRHLSPLGLGRGLNAQWTDGGLIYAPPFR